MGTSPTSPLDLCLVGILCYFGGPGTLSTLSTHVSRQSFGTWEILLDPLPRPEGSYKIGSVNPSFCLTFRLSVSFLRIGSLVFFWNLAWSQGPIYSYVWQSRIFWKKSPSGKNDQKWSKMAQKHGFWTF